MALKKVDISLLSGKSVMVTGGAGFIGSHLSEKLLECNAETLIVDNFSAGLEKNLSHIDSEINVIDQDVRNRAALRKIMPDIDLVFHLAANAHVPTSVERPQYDFEVNAHGTQIVLEEAQNAGVGRVVLASSAAVYGPPEDVPISEAHPLGPVSPYGASKLSGEKLGLAYNESYDIEVTALRIFNTYGPRQPRYVMYDFLRKLDANASKLELLGSGEEVRTFVYVSDTVDALIALALSTGAPGRAFNIGGAESTRIIDLAELMSERFYDGQPELVTTGETKPGDISKLVVDNSRIRELGVEPTTGLIEGLDELYNWFHANPDIHDKIDYN